ncbi:uncharacterized protein LOC143447456 [Clavelina lepadiformis]|uniref:uncharacterized protein LOC143447456 n=1 Tax=Clavelina lepadiformis TaxID=159417 RepID=UPI00404205F8
MEAGKIVFLLVLCGVCGGEYVTVDPRDDIIPDIFGGRWRIMAPPGLNRSITWNLRPPNIPELTFLEPNITDNFDPYALYGGGNPLDILSIFENYTDLFPYEYTFLSPFTYDYENYTNLELPATESEDLLGTPTVVRFTIRGSDVGWIGLGISRDTLMGDDNAYICARKSPGSDTIKVISAELVGQAPPEGLIPLSSSDVIDTRIVGNVMECTFEVPLSVTKNVSGVPLTWDISKENFNLFYAEGDVLPDGNLFYHSFRQHTNRPFNLSTPRGYKIPGFTLSGGGGNWMIPGECETDCRSVSWTPDVVADRVVVNFTIRGREADYVKIALANYQKAPSPPIEAFGDCYYCIRDTSGQVNIMSRGCLPEAREEFQPEELEPIPPEDVIEAQVSGRFLTCSFVRSLVVNRTINSTKKSFDLSRDRFAVIYEEGPTSGGDPLTLEQPEFFYFVAIDYVITNVTFVTIPTSQLDQADQTIPGTDQDGMEGGGDGGMGGRSSSLSSFNFLLFIVTSAAMLCVIT